MKYKNKNFQIPKNIRIYSDVKKIPRKLKKKIKKFAGCHYSDLDNNGKMWYYLEHKNRDYRDFLIFLILENEDNKNLSQDELSEKRISLLKELTEIWSEKGMNDTYKYFGSRLELVEYLLNVDYFKLKCIKK